MFILDICLRKCYYLYLKAISSEEYFREKITENVNRVGLATRMRGYRMGSTTWHAFRVLVEVCFMPFIGTLYRRYVQVFAKVYKIKLSDLLNLLLPQISGNIKSIIIIPKN